VIQWRGNIESLQKELEATTPHITSLKNEARNQAGDDLRTVRQLAEGKIEGIFQSVRKLITELEKVAFIPKNAELGEVYLRLLATRRREPTPRVQQTCAHS
jgi:hypothetical protein